VKIRSRSISAIVTSCHDLAFVSTSGFAGVGSGGGVSGGREAGGTVGGVEGGAAGGDVTGGVGVVGLSFGGTGFTSGSFGVTAGDGAAGAVCDGGCGTTAGAVGVGGATCGSTGADDCCGLVITLALEGGVLLKRPARGPDSAETPTASHAARATATHPFPGIAAKRCCESQRNIITAAKSPALPIRISATALNRAIDRPSPVTHAWMA